MTGTTCGMFMLLDSCSTRRAWALVLGRGRGIGNSSVPLRAYPLRLTRERSRAEGLVLENARLGEQVESHALSGQRRQRYQYGTPPAIHQTGEQIGDPDVHRGTGVQVFDEKDRIA
ncbi:hypothetical protein PENSPDRAFT_156421 [Peniophora sp. CONT]|nr:hypothetical protein PENSPDRAFT_156421 [Peniophora sp. CONT]